MRGVWARLGRLQGGQSIPLTQGGDSPYWRNDASLLNEIPQNRMIADGAIGDGADPTNVEGQSIATVNTGDSLAQTDFSEQSLLESTGMSQGDIQSRIPHCLTFMLTTGFKALYQRLTAV